MINVGDQEVKLQLWDTAGQERYRTVTKSYYRGALGVIIVYDITKYETFQHIADWLKDAKATAKKDCVICVVGNKSDLRDQRVVKITDGAKFCQENSKYVI
jgi:small GTP-binding protein